MVSRPVQYLISLFLLSTLLSLVFARTERGRNVKKTKFRLIVKMKGQQFPIGSLGQERSHRPLPNKFRKKLHKDIYSADFSSQSEANKELKKIQDQIEYVEIDHIIKLKSLPNDPRLDEQRGLERLNVSRAWDFTTGSSDVVVAISDSGVEISHNDLKQQIWTNVNEVPGNGIDDDGNGYVDDVHGWDFVDDDGEPNDSNGHGTHVAGIIGAKGDNGLGVSGVNQKVRLMPVRFLDKNGSGRTSDAIATISYAVDNGAKVINCSWGGPGESKGLQEVLEYAKEKGVLVVAAAGNEDENNDKKPSYPAAYNSENLITVASSKSDGTLSSFSNYGRLGVDLAAPGDEILSTYKGNRFKRLSGTSMASPMVAGLAGLLLSYKNLSMYELKNALLSAVDSKVNYESKLSTGGELKADLLFEQFDDQVRILPARVSLAPGDSFKFTGLNASGLGYSVDSEHAVIDATGRLTIANDAPESELTVSLSDENGILSSTERVSIVVRPASGGGGGCSKDANAVDSINSSGVEHQQRMWMFLSYFLFGLIWLMGRKLLILRSKSKY